MLRGCLQSYWEGFCKNTKRYSVKILKGVFQICWGGIYALPQNEQLPNIIREVDHISKQPQHVHGVTNEFLWDESNSIAGSLKVTKTSPS